MRRCTKCGRELPESEFYVRRDTGGLQSWCIRCCRNHGMLRNGSTGIYRKEEPLNEDMMKENINDKERRIPGLFETGQTFCARVETITPDIAREYLKFNCENRPVSKAHVQFLSKMMKNGEWKLNGEAICFEGDRLVNGQHRLHAVISAGIPVAFLVVRGCERDSFITYDSGKNRSAADVLSIKGVPNYTTVASVINNYTLMHDGASALGALHVKHDGSQCFAGRSRKGGLKNTKQEILDIYFRHEELFSSIAVKARHYSKNGRMMRSSEIGGIFAYLVIDRKHSFSRVDDFFRALFLCEGMQNATISMLRVRLSNDIASSVKMSGVLRQSLITKTWNAYISGVPLKKLGWSQEREKRVEFL